MEKNINVLVVDDSAFMRKVITDMLEQDRRIKVIATARNGQDALDKLKQITPDVITLDIEMPVMDGLTTLKEIMKFRPIPVVMVSSLTTEGATETIQAFEYGAVDFVAKTSGAISLDLYKVKDQMIEKVLLASKVRMKNVLYSSIRKKLQLSQTITTPSSKSPLDHLKKIVAIGTSTGGPKALHEVITKLPKNLKAPVLVVQHMPAGFTKSLANRLNTVSDIEVKEAREGDVVRNGVVYIAPGGYHLVVKKLGTALTLKTVQTSPRKGHRPSVDVMFESLAELTDYQVISVIMTGMGSDGTEGLLHLKNKLNCYAIAESESSSIVFGMPKSAINTKKVDEVVHLRDIAQQILKQC